jgi:DNA-binding NarL/FixJ family response regulator
MLGPLRVLLLEDCAADAELVAHSLHAGGLHVQTERVDSKEEFIRALHQFNPHIVLSDHAVAGFNALAAIEVLRTERPITPLILVSGSVTERMTVNCLRAGAEDVVLKGNLTMLVPTIQAALAIRRPLRKLSPRQLQVLQLIARGETTPQIARRLVLSVKTVESHRAAIMNRIGLHDVVTLVRYAVRVGLVESGVSASSLR